LTDVFAWIGKYKRDSLIIWIIMSAARCF